MFARLLRELDRVPGLERLRFTSPHPKDFRSDTVAAMAECRSVCEHIHLPVQSGSDSVLRRMKRAYSRARYLDKVSMVREAIPEVAITTDIIVGFPGETDAEFEDTLSVVEEVGYDQAFTFQYSPRPGTEAASHGGHLPKDVIQERFERLCRAQEAISLRRNHNLVGRSEEVLVEGPSKKDATRLSGRTRSNRLIHFASDGAAEGSFRTVRVTKASPHHLEGELVGAGSSVSRPNLNLPLIGASQGCSDCG
jgi:tRNA-2-methylthio-N6-dimethylallyladenosine synthase